MLWLLKKTFFVFPSLHMGTYHARIVRNGGCGMLIGCYLGRICSSNVDATAIAESSIAGQGRGKDGCGSMCFH